MPKLVKNNRYNSLAKLENYILSSLKEESISPALVLECLEYLYADRPWFAATSNSQLKRKTQMYKRVFSSLMLLCIKHNIPTSAGFVYAVTHPKHREALKIGSTQDCEDRLGNYQTYCPDRGFSMAWRKISFDRLKDEKELISRFATPKLGEWVSVNYSDNEELSMQLNEFKLNYG